MTNRGQGVVSAQLRIKASVGWQKAELLQGGQNKETRDLPLDGSIRAAWPPYRSIWLVGFPVRCPFRLLFPGLSLPRVAVLCPVFRGAQWLAG